MNIPIFCMTDFMLSLKKFHLNLPTPSSSTDERSHVMKREVLLKVSLHGAKKDRTVPMPRASDSHCNGIWLENGYLSFKMLESRF